MKFLKAVSIILFVSFLVSGCGSGGDDNGGSAANLIRMDLSGAKALVIAPRGTNKVASKADSDEPEVLYKLTEDGLLIEVILYDDSGNIISSQSYLPEHIEDINDEYIFVRFKRFDPVYRQYIVNKSSGAVYHIQNNMAHWRDVFNNHYYFHSEAYGDVHDGKAYYLVRHTGEVHSIEFGSSGVLTDRKVSPEGDKHRQDEQSGPMTAVAKDGTIFYYKDGGYRVISNQGRVIDLVQEIASNQPEFQSYMLDKFGGNYKPFVGTDGAIYFQMVGLLNVYWSEQYFVPMGQTGYPDSPPAPNGPPVLVHDSTGSNPIQPYHPNTGASLDLRNPVSICPDSGCSDLSTMPVDWNWLPIPFEYSSSSSWIADDKGNTARRYDEYGDQYRMKWYNFNIFSPVWRLSEDNDGNFRLTSYGSLSTNNPRLSAEAPEGTLYYNDSSTSFDISRSVRFLRLRNKVIQVHSLNGTVYEVNNETQKPIRVNSASSVLTNLENAESTDTHYYLLGRAVDDAQISLYRFDSETHTPTELIDGSEYELYKFTVTEDNKVVFRGVRRSDGADIGGTIDLSDKITVIEAIQNLDIVQLERVL